MATITVTNDGLGDMAGKMRDIAGQLDAAVAKGLNVGLVKLANYIVQNKLSGQVLNQRSGRLIGSVQSSVNVYQSGGGRATGYIGSVFYGGVQERGATITINSPVDLGGDIGWRYLKTITLPARPWLAPSIQEQSDMISEEIKNAIREVAK